MPQLRQLPSIAVIPRLVRVQLRPGLAVLLLRMAHSLAALRLVPFALALAFYFQVQHFRRSECRLGFVQLGLATVFGLFDTFALNAVVLLLK